MDRRRDEGEREGEVERARVAFGGGSLCPCSQLYLLQASAKGLGLAVHVVYGIAWLPAVPCGKQVLFLSCVGLPLPRPPAMPLVP